MASAASRSRTVPASILDKNLNKTRGTEVSLSAYSFLFSEMLQYAQKTASGISDLEAKCVLLCQRVYVKCVLNAYDERLSEYGYRVGLRYLELVGWRERVVKREHRVLPILSFIYGTLWKALFGKQADSLERGTENADECASFVLPMRCTHQLH